ncbi:BnaC06g10200D [Brassica napus]|uniref:BnaC06g10200D protein n=2 Tax=Brassica TaxID=3705 RepID=A0A078GYT5_BRANA|nr:BnaC06g10200D [Brassica napus]VDD61235.1 unnamed protein product [Brassica oleracea]
MLNIIIRFTYHTYIVSKSDPNSQTTSEGCSTLFSKRKDGDLPDILIIKETVHQDYQGGEIEKRLVWDGSK